MAARGDRVSRVPLGDRGGPASPRRRLWVSRSPGRVVVRYADGRVLKGYADFDPEQSCLRLVPLGEPEAEGLEIPLAELKAVFFVRSFDGDPVHDESKDLYQARPPDTRKVSVRFRDGEELVGPHATARPVSCGALLHPARSAEQQPPRVRRVRRALGGAAAAVALRPSRAAWRTGIPPGDAAKRAMHAPREPAWLLRELTAYSHAGSVTRPAGHTIDGRSRHGAFASRRVRGGRRPRRTAARACSWPSAGPR